MMTLRSTQNFRATRLRYTPKQHKPLILLAVLAGYGKIPQPKIGTEWHQMARSGTEIVKDFVKVRTVYPRIPYQAIGE